jgi:3-hydroxyisobutyrate dehydrogenase
MDTIAVIGLGNMGLPMSARLIEAGYTVYGCDTDAAKVDAFVKQGGKAATLNELHEKAQVVITLLPNSKIVGHVLFGERGLFAQKPAHSTISIVIDMSSSYPLDTQQYAKRLKEFGVALVDAPVSGGVKKAISGELTIMIGGEQKDVERVRPILEKMGSRLYYLGGHGAGHTVKALNNYLSATHLFATVEAVATIEKLGIDPHLAIDVINVSTGRSGSSEYKLPSFILNEAYNSGFSLGLLAKDVKMSHDLITQVLGDDNLAGVIAQIYEDAKQRLGETADHTEVGKWLREPAK